MLGTEFLLVAIGLRLAAGLGYLLATIKGKARPDSVTWFFWGIAPLVAFFAQIQDGIRPEAWVTLIMAAGPLTIFFVSLGRGRHWKIGPFDIMCGASATVGLVLWQITSQPELALIFGILADLFGGIPTLRKSFIAPDSERAFPYFLSMTSMVVTLLTIKDWYFLNFGFPLYMFLINLALFSLIISRIGVRKQNISTDTT